MGEQAKWNAEQILAFLRAHRRELEAMGVVKIGLFGSYVRGEQHRSSDIDFVFALDDMTWARWMDVWNWLEDQLGVEVDLVPEKDLREELRPTVLAEVRYVECLQNTPVRIEVEN